MKVNKRKNKENSNASDKKKSRKRYTLEEKLEIIDLYENKRLSIAEITRQKDITNEASVRTILKKKDELKVQGFHTGEYGAKCATKSRCRLLVEMERLLYVWISECKVPISLAEVQFKAQSLHDWVKDPLNPTCLKDLTEIELNPKKPFVASNGWWHRFRYHSYIT